MNPVRFLLNQPGTAAGGGEPATGGASAPVAAPAFSLTKVLATAALVLTPLSMALIDTLAKVNFSAGQIVTLTVALLAFLAVVSSADVLARAMAAAADLHAKAVTAAADQHAQAAADAHSNGAKSGVVLLLDKPLAARLESDGLPKVTVLAVRGGPENRVLVATAGGKLSWVDEKYVHYG